MMYKTACNYGHPTVNLYMFSVKIITLAAQICLFYNKGFQKCMSKKLKGSNESFHNLGIKLCIKITSFLDSSLKGNFCKLF